MEHTRKTGKVNRCPQWQRGHDLRVMALWIECLDPFQWDSWDNFRRQYVRNQYI